MASLTAAASRSPLLCLHRTRMTWRASAHANRAWKYWQTVADEQQLLWIVQCLSHMHLQDVGKALSHANSKAGFRFRTQQSNDNLSHTAQQLVRPTMDGKMSQIQGQSVEVSWQPRSSLRVPGTIVLIKCMDVQALPTSYRMIHLGLQKVSCVVPLPRQASFTDDICKLSRSQ